jgi:hypothetical protein
MNDPAANEHALAELGEWLRSQGRKSMTMLPGEVFRFPIRDGWFTVVNRCGCVLELVVRS